MLFVFVVQRIEQGSMIYLLFLSFRYQGQIGAALILGGVDINGPHLYTIYPHGSTDKLPYVTMGSGSLAAMSVFESRFVADMEVCVSTICESRMLVPIEGIVY